MISVQNFSIGAQVILLKAVGRFVGELQECEENVRMFFDIPRTIFLGHRRMDRRSSKYFVLILIILISLYPVIVC